MARRKTSGGPEWLEGEAERAEELRDSGQTVNNPSASATPRRSLKGFRIRQDYQRRYDVLVATVKHTQGKKGYAGQEGAEADRGGSGNAV